MTLSLPPDTAGYCVITAGENTYRTEYIARHTESEPKTLTFSLVVATAQTVTFTPRWGIYTQEANVRSGGAILIQ